MQYEMYNLIRFQIIILNLQQVICICIKWTSELICREHIWKTFTFTAVKDSVGATCGARTVTVCCLSGGRALVMAWSFLAGSGMTCPLRLWATGTRWPEGTWGRVQQGHSEPVGPPGKQQQSRSTRPECRRRRSRLTTAGKTSNVQPRLNSTRTAACGQQDNIFMNSVHRNYDEHLCHSGQIGQSQCKQLFQHNYVGHGEDSVEFFINSVLGADYTAWLTVIFPTNTLRFSVVSIQVWYSELTARSQRVSSISKVTRLERCNPYLNTHGCHMFSL